jgi:hypothetical protein
MGLKELKKPMGLKESKEPMEPNEPIELKESNKLKGVREPKEDAIIEYKRLKASHDAFRSLLKGSSSGMFTIYYKFQYSFKNPQDRKLNEVKKNS